MLLKDALEGMVNNGEQMLLNDSKGQHEAENLLNQLSEVALNRQVHKTQMYIALVDNGGYMGEVLYRLSPKN